VFRLQCRPMGGPNRPTRASVVPRDDLFDLEVTRGDGAVDRLAGFLGAARWDPAVYPHVRSMVQHREAPLPAMGAYLHGLAWLARAARGW
jgi:hypothetical protein